MFPSSVDEVAGPTFILLPTEPVTCLAVSAVRLCVVVFKDVDGHSPCDGTAFVPIAFPHPVDTEAH